MLELTPRQIVEELDKYIVGQNEAKRAIAVAIRNRWRRQRVEGEIRDEIGPKNMMMIGPTGVGKTEIARRLASLTGAPFIKVDATKYTEVGYYGRDVESMARELVENAAGIVRTEEREKNATKAREAAERRIVDALVEKFKREDRDLSEFDDSEVKEEETSDETEEQSAPTDSKAESRKDDIEDKRKLRDELFEAASSFPGFEFIKKVDPDGALFDEIMGFERHDDKDVKDEDKEDSDDEDDDEDSAVLDSDDEDDFEDDEEDDDEDEEEDDDEDEEDDDEDEEEDDEEEEENDGKSNDTIRINVKYDPRHPERSLIDVLSSLAHVEDKPQDNERKREPLKKSRRSSSKKVDLRAEVERLLAGGKLEDEIIPVHEERRPSPIVMGGAGIDSMPEELQNVLESMTPKRRSHRMLKVSEAREILIDQESERLLDKDDINERAIELAENLGVIFIDEIDKIVGSESGHGADVSRQGVQRDLLPIVEGTTIQTKFGLFSTEHVLFIAAGAFHRVKPSDLTPELQGRFPIRVELSELKKEDFVRILTEPKSALTKQYAALMKTENVELVFKDDAIDAIASYAAETNLTTQNIGARRLYTIMELLLEDLNFEAAEMESGRVEIDAEYVRSKLEKVVRDEDLSKFVL